MQLLGGLEEPLRVHLELPVFRMRRGGLIVYYTPGTVVPVPPECESALRAALSGAPAGETVWTDRAARVLLQDAARVVDRWKRFVEHEFSPEVLAVRIGNGCNLACAYCFSRVDRSASCRNPLEAITQAARLVLGECARKGRAAKLVLNGGGEPTMYWDSLVSVVNAFDAEARGSGVPWRCQVSTNACFEGGRVAWLARNIHLISISSDGPPDLQNCQRPFPDGSGSSEVVERNARALADAGARIEVRCTITPSSVDRQAEVVMYAHERLHASSIRLEPVFQTTEWDKAEPEEMALRFVRGFMAAEAEARERHCSLGYSGVRLDEIHGPYCDVLRDTLLVGAGGMAYACTFRVGDRHAVVGRPGGDGRYALDRGRIAALRGAAGAIPSDCETCINAYHCARMCPAFCHARSAPLCGSDGAFRCLVSRLLAVMWVLDAASRLGSTYGSAEPEETNCAVRRDYAIQGHHPAGPLV
jgi:sulfatase maturation enzyme AslB (radical SAM superfamily)